MSANANPNLAVHTVGLTKVFRDFWGQQRVIAVNDLDLDVHAREVFGLLGPNGSGKSTTIKMLLGLLFPSRGVARVLGRPPGDVKTNLRIGYLPEESHLYPFLNARETLDFYGRLFGLQRRERQRRIDSLLDMVGLAGVGKRTVGEFSKGMARRIGLAQALINDPDLLILDEPTSGLDPIGTRQIKDLISELGRRGKTVLLCSHLLADVEDVCDRICILYGGKTQAQGRVEELLAREEYLQIHTPHLSEAAVQRIRAAVAEEHPDAEIETQTPHIRLEEYFLDIVEKAQADEQQTSGAVMGQGVSDFLRAAAPAPSETEQVIAELVQPTAPPAALQPEVDTEKIAAPPAPEVEREVLSELVTADDARRPSPSQTEPVESAAAPSEQTPETEVDRDLLDTLAGKRRRGDDQDQRAADQQEDGDAADRNHPA